MYIKQPPTHVKIIVLLVHSAAHRVVNFVQFLNLIFFHYDMTFIYYYCFLLHYRIYLLVLFFIALTHLFVITIIKKFA
jgi:hypothetical protein